MASEQRESNPDLCNVISNRNNLHSAGRHRHFRAGENDNMKHMYTTDVVEKYNRREDSARRLNGSEEHQAIKGKASYFSLCSFTHTIMYRRKRFQKKGGFKMRKWCMLCSQPICRSCWDVWHTEQTLPKSKISPAELAKPKEKARTST